MTKCLIIGAGIVGLTTALELKRNGYDVTILDAEKEGRSSKSAAGIMLPLSPWKNSKTMQDLCALGHQEYYKFFNNLSNEDKKIILYDKKNILIFGDNLESSKKWYHNNNYIKSNFFEKKLNIEEDNIRGEYENYLKVKGIYIIDPVSLILYYKKKLKQKNIKFIKEDVNEIHNYVNLKKNKYYDFFVVTAGTWSNEILENNEIILKPIKGQVINIKTNKKIIDNVLFYNDYYIIPKGETNLLVGATVEDVGFDNSITKEANSYLLKSLSEIFSSELSISNITQSFGFRPYTNTDSPYIKNDSQNKRIIYNFGHYRYGILTAIPSAKIVKKLML